MKHLISFPKRLPNARGIVLVTGLALALVACKEDTMTDTDFMPLDTTVGDDGWLVFSDPGTLDVTTAAETNPVMITPASVVIRFLASQIRGDEIWRETMASGDSRKTEMSIETWEEWGLTKAELRSYKLVDEETAWVKVYFEITYSGGEDSGTDEFELGLTDDGWRIVSAPG